MVKFVPGICFCVFFGCFFFSTQSVTLVYQKFSTGGKVIENYCMAHAVSLFYFKKINDAKSVRQKPNRVKKRYYKLSGHNSS